MLIKARKLKPVAGDFSQIGSAVGGPFVFGATNLMGAYKDLLTNKTMAPAKSGSVQ